MKNKVGSFVSSIVTLVLSLIAGFAIWRMYINVPTEGIEILASIALLPVFFILYLVTLGLLISTIATSIRAITSYNKGIRITSIVLLIIALILIAVLVWSFLKLFRIGG